jgi:hypothetical protein
MSSDLRCNKFCGGYRGVCANFDSIPECVCFAFEASLSREGNDCITNLYSEILGFAWSLPVNLYSIIFGMIFGVFAYKLSILEYWGEKNKSTTKKLLLTTFLTAGFAALSQVRDIYI